MSPRRPRAPDAAADPPEEEGGGAGTVARPQARRPDSGPGSTSVPSRGWSPRAVALLVGAALLVTAVTLDRSYSRRVQEAARETVRRRTEPLGHALSGTVKRRLGLLEGLRGWLATAGREDMSGFEDFAATVLPTVPGLRTVQVVEDGVIAWNYPPEGNEGVLGYDLRRHPNPLVRSDLARAEGSDRLVVTAIDSLIQGGKGLIVRRRVPPDGGPSTRLASLVFDLPVLLAEAGLNTTSTRGLRVHLHDRDGRNIWTSGTEPDPDALSVEVDIEDGAFVLRAEPVGGWSATGGFPQQVARAFALLAVLLATLLAYQIVDRRRRLEAAVLQRTALLARANRELGTAVDALRAQDDRLNMALRAGGVTTWEWDLESGEVHHFPGTLDAVDVDPETGAALFEAVEARVHPEDLPRFQRASRRTREEGVDFDIEYRVVLPDGSVRWRHDSGRVTEDGRCVRGAVADVTRSKEMEEELSHARKMEAIGQLAGGIAHDFNNLMQVVLGHATLLQTDPGPDDVTEGLDEIVKAADQASVLTTQLLAFSRRRPARPEPLDLAHEVPSAAAMLQRLLGEQIRIHLDVEDAPVVFMDASQFTQVLVNLATNARDSMPEGGTLTIRARTRQVADPMDPLLPAGAYGVLEVEDEGEGIAPEIRGRIFDPFFTTKGPGRGTGLGLASVHGSVRQAGGSVVVESRPGQGSTFTVLLPLAPEGTAGREPPPPPPRNADGAVVLLVEDDPAVRRLTTRVLARAGHTVMGAQDAEEAWALVDTEGIRPAILVSDVILPTETGPALARRLRERLPDLGVLFVSGYPKDERLADWHGDPRAMFVEKPFSPSELTEALERLLE